MGSPITSPRAARSELIFIDKGRPIPGRRDDAAAREEVRRHGAFEGLLARLDEHAS